MEKYVFDLGVRDSGKVLQGRQEDCCSTCCEHLVGFRTSKFEPETCLLSVPALDW